jgi:hypothetical protein
LHPGQEFADTPISLDQVNGKKWFSLDDGLNFSVFTYYPPDGSPPVELAIGCEEISNATFHKYYSLADVDSDGKDPTRPAKVTQQQAMRFCYDLNAELGNSVSCYEVRMFNGKPIVVPMQDFFVHRAIRLPVLTEWEQACGAETRSNTYTGYNLGERIDNYEYHKGNSGGHAHASGSKLPNQFGLFDMWGNEYEWVQDTKNEDQNKSTRPPAKLNVANEYFPKLFPFYAGARFDYESSSFSVCHTFHPFAANHDHEAAFRVIFTVSWPQVLAKETKNARTFM